MYQPIPFKGYEGKAHVRGDCAERYKVIKDSLGDVTGKTILDFGCAEGYFGFSFLKDGAKEVTFIDNDEGCLKIIEDVALHNGFSTKCRIYNRLETSGPFNIALLLDLWGHGSEIPPLSKFKEMADIVIVSPSGNGNDMSSKLKAETQDLFSKVTEILTNGYNGRSIYKCEKENV